MQETLGWFCWEFVKYAGAAGHLCNLGWDRVVGKRVEHVPNSEPPEVVIKVPEPGIRQL